MLEINVENVTKGFLIWFSAEKSGLFSKEQLSCLGQVIVLCLRLVKYLLTHTGKTQNN